MRNPPIGGLVFDGALEPGNVHAAAGPFLVGETIPGWCGGLFDLDTMGHVLRVEAVGADWVVLRDQDTGSVWFYEGGHDDLRRSAAWERGNRDDSA